MNFKHTLLLSGFLCATINVQTTLAAEGGSSSYLQGTYGDFASGMLGQKGLYVRNDFLYYDASIPFAALGSPADGYLSQSIWGDLLKLAYISDRKILGGRYNAAILIPIIFGSRVTRNVAGRAPSKVPDSNVSGLGDIYATPLALGWQWDQHHLNANLSFIAPTGGYDDSRILSAGRNYWSIDPTINYTWLNEHRGRELTITLGYLHNWKNATTHYTTGDELHLDWTLAQHFSERLAIGITGYWYEQTTSDSGAIPSGFTATDFDARGAGIGPALAYTPKIAGHNVVVIAKWIADTTAKNRLDGDVFTLSFAWKLQ